MVVDRVPGEIVWLSPAGALALVLYALEGAFLAAVALLAGRLVRGALARVWVLAGVWVGLEWLRFLGPLAFPWPSLGYTLLPTPMIQVADLGGVLLGSVIVAGTAAALVSFWLDRRVPLLAMSAVWVLALAYGVTRTPLKVRKDAPCCSATPSTPLPGPAGGSLRRRSLPSIFVCRAPGSLERW
ncbi:hypothetical protein ACFSC4_03915 [Deinococcus malanensis]|uniref:hypothetical protein n=1 Tax=Deinococcus malanensis TaxID=1706855 RepID=UPI003624CFB4